METGAYEFRTRDRLEQEIKQLEWCSEEQLERAILECRLTIMFVEHDGRFGTRTSNRILEL